LRTSEAFATLSRIEGQGEVRDGILQSLWSGHRGSGVLSEVRRRPGSGNGSACSSGREQWIADGRDRRKYCRVPLLLVYLVSGLIFLLIDKRPFVRFHGAQSIALCVCAAVLGIGFWIVVAVITFVLALVHIPIGFLLVFLWPVIGFGFFIAWVFCMYKAFQHEKFKLPIIGNMVEKMIGV